MKMTESEKKKCNYIIHTASASAAAIGGGLAQVPGADNIPLSALQCTMIISIASVFNQSITKSTAQSILASQLATISGRAISQFLVGWMPGIGNAINASTAAGITETIGWAAADYFNDN
jgi:uncharacterized protein (DUF697 family)